MKKIITVLLMTILIPCVVSYSQVLDWKNKILQENRHISYSSISYTNAQYSPSYSNTTISFSNGAFNSTNRSLRNARQIGGGGFGGSSISYSNGSYSNGGETYTNLSTSIPFQTYSPSELMLSNKKYDGISVYAGDEPGIITGGENKLLDNPIIGASTYAIDNISVDCDKCHEHLGDITVNSYSTRNGTRYEVNVESNNSLLSLIIKWLTGSGLTETQKNARVEEIRQKLIENHKCKETHDTPIGDISFGIILMFILTYCVALKFNRPIH